MRQTSGSFHEYHSLFLQSMDDMFHDLCRKNTSLNFVTIFYILITLPQHRAAGIDVTSNCQLSGELCWKQFNKTVHTLYYEFWAINSTAYDMDKETRKS
jgi:hypothetical protein